MNIREVIPAVVEEVICGVEACQKQGLDVFPPEAIEIEMPVCGCAKVNVRIPLFAGMRTTSEEFDRRDASKCVGGNTSRRSSAFVEARVLVAVMLIGAFVCLAAAVAFVTRGQRSEVGGRPDLRWDNPDVPGATEERRSESGCNGFREAEPARQANRKAQSHFSPIVGNTNQLASNP